MKIRAKRTYRRARGQGLATPPNVYDEPEEVARRAIDNGRAEAVTGGRAEELMREHTRDELYKRAQDMDIDGRTKMDEAELAARIAEAE